MPELWETQNVEYLVLAEPSNGIEWLYVRQPGGEFWQRRHGPVEMVSANTLLTNLYDWIKNGKPYRVGQMRDVPDVYARPPECGHVNTDPGGLPQPCRRQKGHEGRYHANPCNVTKTVFLMWLDDHDWRRVGTLDDLLEDRIQLPARLT